jgi:hypothetical protein
LAIAAAGDLVVLAAALAVVAMDTAGALAALGAVVATGVRMATTSLPALAGAQAVLGPAALVGPPTAAASTVLAGVSLVLAPVNARSAVPFALGAALIVAGPSPHTAADVAIRVVGVVISIAAAWSRQRWLPRAASWVAAACGGGAIVLALVR